MTRHIIATSIILLSAIYSSAQVSGYLGQRATVGVQFPFGLRLNNNSDTKPYGLNFRQELYASYLVGKYIGLGVSYKHQKTPQDDVYVEYKFSANGDYLRFEGSVDISSNMFSAYIEFYANNDIEGALPPIGTYRRLELVYIRCSGKITESYTTSSIELETKDHIPDLENMVAGAGMLLYTKGKKIILYDKLILEYGGQLGLPLNPTRWEDIILDGRNRIYVIAGSEDALAEELGYDFTTRISSTMLMAIHISIGYLAF